MTELRYPPGSLRADYFRAAAGLALSIMPLMLLALPRPSAAFFLALGLLFMAFTLRTGARHRLRVELGDDAIRIKGLVKTTLRWQDLQSVGLRYYSTRRDGSEGWMQIKLKGGRRVVRLDSSFGDFERIVERAVRAAGDNGLVLGDTTMANLALLGRPRHRGGAKP